MPLLDLPRDVVAALRNKRYAPLDDNGLIPPAYLPSTGSGTGDVSSNTSTSVIGELLVFADTSGKLTRRATGTGLAKITSGVLGTAVAGTDYASASHTHDFGTLIGTITAGQIYSVNASAIIGGITADKITTVNAGSIVGDITADMIGSVYATDIDGLIQSDQIQEINVDKINGAIIADQIASVHANTIGAGIIATQISSVSAGVITGPIISTQLADGIIDSLKLIATDIMVIRRVASLPTLPSSSYPTNSVVLRTSDSTLWKNVSGTWTAVLASETLTGSITEYDIVSVNASAINGVIAAAHIGGVEAVNINGLIDSDQIDNISVTKLDGLIQSSQINTLSVTKLDGAILSSQIDTIVASKIDGTISHTQIGSVNAATITVGAITHSQIASVNAATITVGTIAASQIASIDASTITVGTLSSTQIGSINANTITLGTLDVANRIASGSITAGKLSVSQLDAISANLGSITAGSIDISSSNSYLRTRLESALLRQGYFSVISNSSSASTTVSVTSPTNSAEIRFFTNVSVEPTVSFYNTSGTVVASWSSNGGSINATGITLASQVSSGTTYLTSSSSGTTSYYPVRVDMGSNAGAVPSEYALGVIHRNNATSKYGLFVGTNWAASENKIVRFASVDASSGVVDPAFEVLGDKSVKFYYRVYDGSGNQVLRERSGTTPTTLSDVISILQYHGLCS